MDAEWEKKAGRFFGYPECCIDEFEARIILAEVNGGKYEKSYAEISGCSSHGTGFIPCKNHTDQILSGELRVEDIIKNRICSTPFPDGGSIEEFKKFMYGKEETH